MAARWYIGVSHKTTEHTDGIVRSVFKSITVPLVSDGLPYDYAIGPFSARYVARWFAANRYATFQSMADATRVAKGGC